MADRAVSETIYPETLHKPYGVFPLLRYPCNSEEYPKLIWTKSQAAKLVSIMSRKVILDCFLMIPNMTKAFKKQLIMIATTITPNITFFVMLPR